MLRGDLGGIYFEDYDGWSDFELAFGIERWEIALVEVKKCWRGFKIWLRRFKRSLLWFRKGESSDTIKNTSWMILVRILLKTSYSLCHPEYIFWWSVNFLLVWLKNHIKMISSSIIFMPLRLILLFCLIQIF